MFKFVAMATDLEICRIWSSYTRIDDVDSMMKSQRLDYNEYIKAAVS